MITLGKARKLRALIESVITYLSDEDALTGIQLFPYWQQQHAYAIGDRVQYNNKLYKAVQAHTSQADWTPDITSALFVQVAPPRPTAP